MEFTYIAVLGGCALIGVAVLYFTHKNYFAKAKQETEDLEAKAHAAIDNIRETL
jgi:hypothetical protein